MPSNAPPTARTARSPGATGPADFASICNEAGFEADYLGGYLSLHELQQLEPHLDAAIADERLDAEHRDFLRELEMDDAGPPTWRGVHAGVGGSYSLLKS